MTLRTLPWSTALVLAIVVGGYVGLRLANQPIPHELAIAAAMALAALPSLLGWQGAPTPLPFVPFVPPLPLSPLKSDPSSDPLSPLTPKDPSHGSP